MDFKKKPSSGNFSDNHSSSTISKRNILLCTLSENSLSIFLTFFFFLAPYISRIFKKNTWNFQLALLFICNDYQKKNNSEIKYKKKEKVFNS